MDLGHIPIIPSRNGFDGSAGVVPDLCIGDFAILALLLFGKHPAKIDLDCHRHQMTPFLKIQI
jgi:hypothetical protein